MFRFHKKYLVFNKKGLALISILLISFILLVGFFSFLVLADEPIESDWQIYKRTATQNIYINTETREYSTTIGQGIQNFDDKSKRGYPNYIPWNSSYFPVINSTYKDYEYELDSTYSDYQAYFQDDIKSGKGFRFEVNDYWFTYDLSGGKMQWAVENKTTPDWGKTKSIGACLSSSPHTHGNNKIRYNNSFLNTDVQYEMRLNGVKENFVLSSLPSGSGDYIYLEYTGELQFDRNLTIWANGEIQTSKEFTTTGKVEFKDSTNQTIFQMPSPIAEDSNGNSVGLVYDIKPNAEKLTFGLKTPISFLESAVYPVYIDPTITLQTADSANLDDSYVRQINPNDNYGNDDYTNSNLNETDGDASHMLYKFNISSIPSDSSIVSAFLAINLPFNYLDSTTEGYNVSVHHLYSFPTYNISDAEWTETAVTWNERPIAGEFNATLEDTIKFDGNSATDWHTWTVTNIVNTAYGDGDKNVSFWMPTYDAFGTIQALPNDRLIWYSKEHTTTSTRPYLNITYTPYIDIITPTSSQIFTEDEPTTYFNITSNNATSCLWTPDSGATNYTMTAVNSTFYTLSNTSMVDGSHTISFWCNDTSNNWYESDTVSFDIDSVNVTVCRDLSVAGRNYSLLNDINLLFTDSTSNCIYIKENNIGFDGNNKILNISLAQNHKGVIWIDSSADYFNLTNIIINSHNRGSGLLIRAEHGNVYNFNITTRSISSGEYGIETATGYDNNFTLGWINSTIADIEVDGSRNIFRDIEIKEEVRFDLDGSSSTTTLINVTSRESFIETAVNPGQLKRKWYFSPQVNYTNGTAVVGANVTAYNITGGVQESELTDSNGQISRWELIEYVNNGGTKTYYTNYTFNATLSNWNTDSQSINLTTNYLNRQFNISDTTAPVSTITMTKELGGSYTNDTWTSKNINITIDTSDSGSGFDNTVYPIYCNDSTNTCDPNIYISEGIVISTEGTSYIRYYANDTAGNNESIKMRTLKIDTTVPNITIALPSNNTNSSDTNLDINYTVTDSLSGIDSCWYSNGTLTSNLTLANCVNITAVWAEGSHTVTIWVNDSVNNINSSSVTFTIDTTKPVSVITSPLNQSYNTNVSDLNYTFTETNCESVWYSLDSGATNSSASACSTNFTGLSSVEGSNTWTIYLNDSANNQNSTSVTFHKDTTYPQISIKFPTNYTNSSDTSLDVNYTATDTYLDSCWWSNDTGANNNSLASCTNITSATWTDSTLTVIVWVNDTVNNVNWTSVIFTIDSTNPVANLTYPLNNTYNSTLTQNFTYNVSDNLGVSNSTLYIWNSTGEYNLTNSIFGSGVLEDTVGIVVTLVEGVYNWWVKVWDWAGNTFTTGNQTIIIDTTISLIVFDSTTETNATYKQTSDIFINVTVTETNIDTVQFSFDDVNETFADSGGTSYWENKTGLSEGAHTFYAWINDSANNYNETATRTVYIDLNNPSVTILFPTASSYNYNTSINLNYSATDTYLDSCWYNLDETANITLASCTNLTDGFNTSEATHTLFLYANDSSGREGSDTVQFVISLSPPSITLNYPTDDEWLNYKKNVDFNFTATDIGGLDTCQLWGNWTGTWHKNYTWLAPTSGAITSTTLNLTDGVGEWNVWCNNSGNHGAWGAPTSNYTFNIDSVYPQISYGTGISGDFANLSQSSIYINLSLTEINLKSINFTLRNDSGTVNTSGYASTKYTINWTNLDDNNYTYYVNITDKADNINSTAIKIITIDSTNPVANLTFPLNNTYNSTLTQNFTFNVSDNLGVSNLTLYIWNSTGEYNSTNSTFSSGVLEDTIGIVVTLVEGAYNWWVKVWDWAGNTFTTGNQTITIDVTVPIIDYGDGTANDDLNTSSTELYINVSVIETNEDTITFTIHNSTGKYNITSYLDSTRVINLTNVIDGVYTYNVTINDSAGQSFNTSTRIIRIDDTKPSILIIIPAAQNYATNNSMELNYTASDNVVGLDKCWYRVYNKSGGAEDSLIISSTTLTSCQNTTFSLPGGDIDYNLYLFAKDLIPNTQSKSVTFGIRTESPVVVLTTVNNTHSNSIYNYFNFTVETNADSILNCSLYGNWSNWHLNKTLLNPSESIDTNFSKTSLSEGNYFWNVFCTDNLNNSGWALNNHTYVVDLTNPGINVTKITTTSGSQTFNFNTTVTDNYLSGVTCKYSIFNSTGSVDGVENISTTCNVQVAGTASGYDSYNLTVYATDQAGNENSSTKQFTTSQAVSTSSPGGGVETVIQEVLVEQIGVCGNGICEPEYGETFWTCSDCGGLNADDLFLSCFSDDPMINQKCITKQAPVVFWLAVVLILVTAIAMVIKIPGVKKYQAKIFQVPTKQKPVKKKPSLATAWLKNQQNFIRRWRR